MFLAGRESARIDPVAQRCKAAGAVGVVSIVQDLQTATGDIVAAIAAQPIQVVVNVASAMSRFRDDEVSSEDLTQQVAVDLLSPLELIRAVLSNNQGVPRHFIFISTFLTLIKGPNRAIYSSLKILQEEYLRRFQAEHPTVGLTIVRVGKVISPNHDSPEAGSLAQAVVSAYIVRKSERSSSEQPAR